MKISKLIYLSLVLVLSVANYAHARNEKPCSGTKENLECLKENFSDIYNDQYFKFLIIVSKAETAALNCNSSEITAAYLDIASIIGKNLEVEYGFKDILESKLLKEKTACLLDALLLSNDNVKKIILGKYLTEPRYIKKKEVDTILSKYMEQEKYKEMLKHYSGK